MKSVAQLTKVGTTGPNANGRIEFITEPNANGGIELTTGPKAKGRIEITTGPKGCNTKATRQCRQAPPQCEPAPHHVTAYPQANLNGDPFLNRLIRTCFSQLFLVFHGFVCVFFVFSTVPEGKTESKIHKITKERARLIFTQGSRPI